MLCALCKVQMTGYAKIIDWHNVFNCKIVILYCQFSGLKHCHLAKETQSLS